MQSKNRLLLWTQTAVKGRITQQIRRAGESAMSARGKPGNGLLIILLPLIFAFFDRTFTLYRNFLLHTSSADKALVRW